MVDGCHLWHVCGPESWNHMHSGPLPNAASKSDAWGHVIDMLLNVDGDMVGLCGEVMAAVVRFPDVELGEEKFLRFISSDV